MSIERSKYYLYWSISFIVIILIAFAPRYWMLLLKGDFSSSNEIHWHSFFATSWILIYFIQVNLIRKNAVKLHRNLGFLSIVFTIGILISGFYVSVELVKKALLVNSPGAKPLLLVNLLDLIMFAVLFSLGLKHRKLAIKHKRFITLSAIVLLNAALFRIGRFIIGPGFVAVLLAIVLTSSMIILFVKSEKKISLKPNKQIWRIAILIILTHIVRIPIAITPFWANITDYILANFT